MKHLRDVVRISLFTALFFAVYSCGSRREIVYVNNIQDKTYEQVTQYEAVLQPDDLLFIQVVGQNQEVTAPFNLPELGQNSQDSRNLRSYLIDNQGYIDFPVLGKVKISGLTRTEAKNKLTTAISEYIVNPTVIFSIENYKISVLGEVVRPASYPISGERVTLLEALAMAGDMTIYGRRDNVLLIREKDGKKTHTRINITDASLIDSEYYYLTQNDVVYVEPNNTKIHSSTIGSDIYLIFSAITVFTTLIIVLSR